MGGGEEALVVLHVVKRVEAEILRMTQLIEAPVHWPPERPRKTWGKNRQEELASSDAKQKKHIF